MDICVVAICECRVNVVRGFSVGGTRSGSGGWEVRVLGGMVGVSGLGSRDNCGV